MDGLLVREIPFRGVTDAAKVRQILLNLLSNAVRFTDAGEVDVELELDEAAAVLRVRDTALGIAPKHAERIFEPFSQVTQSLTSHRGGTGLGFNFTLSREQPNQHHIAFHRFHTISCSTRGFNALKGNLNPAAERPSNEEVFGQ